MPEPRPPDDTTPEIPDPLMDGDGKYLAAARSSVDPQASVLLRAGLYLMRLALSWAPQPWTSTAVNDFAAVACFTRCYRQIRAATLLAMFGYYSEVSTVLRGAYESGSLGRYLAHEPEKAEKWLEKNGWLPKKSGWIPDREVREWFGGGDSYADFYGGLSKLAHPTARSCVPLLDPSEKGYEIKFSTIFTADQVDGSLSQVLGVLLWACFALKNAAPDEDALPPHWRQGLAEFANETNDYLGEKTGVSGDYSNLQKDWEEEHRRWQEYLDRATRAADLDDLLDQDPRSWKNLKAKDLDE
jgi:hypothetical protein